MRFLLEISFKGTAYHGWQVQQNAVSIQSIIEEKLAVLLRHPVPCTGCGRTDTGVHARQFFLHFDTGKIPEQFLYHLNRILPWDIAAHNIYQVRDDFHARFDGRSRTYKYYITRRKDPFLLDFSYYRHESLNLGKMNEAASMLIGEKDFRCFSKTHTQVNHYRCDLTEATWIAEGSLYIFTITANRFLRNMVRAVVGTMIDIGKGEISPADMPDLLEKGDRASAGFSVPAAGLFLNNVRYPEDDENSFINLEPNSNHSIISKEIRLG